MDEVKTDNESQPSAQIVRSLNVNQHKEDLKGI